MVKQVSFWATKVKKIPVLVTFRTWDGRKVSFKATKAIRVPKKVSFYPKRRTKWG
jgi:hypothetical protein